MKFLASIKIRIFIISWFIFSIHFATNVVREHYPAFSLAEHGSFKVDEYQGFHPDIFVHTNDHSYINNNVASSVIAAVPLLIFRPVLNMLERYEKGKIQQKNDSKSVYRTRHTNSIKFLKLAKEKGLSFRFGASAMITTVFLMAPLSSLAVVLMFQILSQRGLSTRQCIWLSLLFSFGTPVFFRTGVLNHNMFIMYAVLLAFYLLWARSGERSPVSLKCRLGAGFLCGFGLAVDYSGVIPLMVLYGYLVIRRLSTASLRTSTLESIPFVLGSVPPVLFLLYSQWAMFGNPIYPGQFWMPNVEYIDRGFRGFAFPTLDLFYLNLFDKSYGMYAYGPIMAMGLIPTCFYSDKKLILPRPERLMVIIFFVLFLIFCAANQYSRVQFNSGFRYLLPVIPLIYLSVCDHLIRIPRRILFLITVPVLTHSWVISMVREPVTESWYRVITEGIQLPWLTVIMATSSREHPLFGSFLLSFMIVSFTFFLAALIWQLGSNSEVNYETT